MRLWESLLNKLLMNGTSIDGTGDLYKVLQEAKDNAVRGDIESHKEYLTQRVGM